MTADCRKWIFALGLAVAGIVLGGCNQTIMKKMAPASEEAADLHYIELIRSGDFDGVETALDPAIRNSGTRAVLLKMKSLIPDGVPVSQKVVGVQTLLFNGVATINLTFEYEFPSKWLLINVATQTKNGHSTVVGFHVIPMPESLEHRNRFTLTGKSVFQYAVLASAIAAATVSVYALIRCIRTKMPRRKWLWIIFILFGFGSLGVNWTTGEWGVTPIAFQLFSAGAMRPFYGTWTVCVSLPLGAILFLVLRTRPAFPPVLSEPESAPDT
jgi:hypothetical protein